MEFATSETPEWFLPTITSILEQKLETPKMTDLKFVLSEEAANHNMQLLSRYENSINKFMMANPGSIISPGSEFRPANILEPLLMHHHNWPTIKKILQNGSDWPLYQITNEDRIDKNNEFITRGNHKSAKKYKSEYIKIILSEVNQGWMIPLPLTYINSLHHGELAPVGIDNKVWSELPDGSRKIKFRLTHDQSFEKMKGTSVNSRVITENLNTLVYGGCLTRLINYIVDLRYRHPGIAILGGKSDFKAAYRRVTLHGDIAEKCAIMLDNFSLPSTRLTFGGSPCPYHFCLFSEMTADLANDLLHCPSWDPRLLFSPHADKLPEPVIDSEEEFASAKSLDIMIPPDDMGKIDIFIDDGLAITIDKNDNKFRAVQSLLLAMHILCRPVDHNDPIPREDCLSLSKLAEEGQLAEKFTILGWNINTRTLTISLPDKKFKTWSKDLEQIINKRKVSFSMLESTLGRLNHAATACPIMRYFLGRIRSILTAWDVAKKTKKVERYLSSQVLEDIKLWREDFLPKIHEGLSLNLIAFRRPSFLCWSDACPEGLGGFDHLGYAWRMAIPFEFRKAVAMKNNCLEFIATLITVWQAILMKRATREDCFLSQGDNTSAVGWLHKANIDPDKNLPLFLATRKFAQVLLHSNTCLYSQHIPGISNVVADSLSRKFELNDEDLTYFVHSSPHYQGLPSLKICPVHPEIASWMTYWLQKNKEMMESHRIQKTKKQESGNVGQNTQFRWDSTKTYGCPTSYLNNESTSWEPLPPPLDADSFLDLTKRNWLQKQSKRPWQNWVRSLGQTWGTTPHMEQDLTRCIHYLPVSSEECEI